MSTLAGRVKQTYLRFKREAEGQQSALLLVRDERLHDMAVGYVVAKFSHVSDPLLKGTTIAERITIVEQLLTEEGD